MQEAFTRKTGLRTITTRSGDKVFTTRKPPFRAGFRPVRSPCHNIAFGLGPGQSSRPLGTCNHPGLANNIQKPIKRRAIHRAINIAIIKGHTVGCGIMQTGNENRRIGNANTAIYQTIAHRLIIEQICQKTCIHIPGMPTARPAMKRTFMRVIGDIRAMTGQQNRLCKTMGQRHRTQDLFGNIAFRPIIKCSLKHRLWRFFCFAFVPSQPHRAFRQFPDISWPNRIDIGKGCQCGCLDLMPRADGLMNKLVNKAACFGVIMGAALQSR